MIEQINHLAQLWWDWMSAMFWQVGLLILLIALIDLLIRRWAWPQLRYALWSLILLKLVLSPGLSLPSGLAPKLKPVVTQMLETAAQEKLIEVKLPIAIPSARDEFRQSVTPHASYTLADVEDIPAVDGPVEATGPLVRVGPRLDWRVYAMAVWLLGAITLGMWLFVKLYRLSRKYPDGPRQPALPESFYDQLERCAQKLNLRRKPRVVATTHLQSPAVFGPFRPVLLMPVGYIRKLSRKDTEYMLLHELAHIKRGDLIAHSFYMLLQLVYWYNPLLWLVRKQLRHLRELCCDATVASLLRDRTVEYRQTLLEAARRFLATPAETGLALVGLFEDSNRLIARINWLKKPVWRYRKMKSAAVITVVLVLLACVLPMAQGQQKSADPNDRQETVSAEQAEESSSPSEQTVTTEQDQIQAKEQLLQAQKVLQAQAERLQIERKTLEQLRIDKQQLLQQVQKLIQAQQAKNEAAQVELKAKLAQEIVAQVLAQAKQAEAKALKAKTEAEAKKADAEARKAEAEAKKAKALAKQLELWAGSDAFKQGQKNLDKWAQEQAKAHEKVQEADALVVPVPNPDPQPMPVVAPAPMPPSEAEAVGDAPAPPAPAAAEAVASPPPAPAAPIAPASPAPPEPPSAVAPPLPAVPVLPAMPAAPAAPPAPSNVPLLSAAATVEPAPAPPAAPAPKPATKRQIEVSKNKDGKYVATTEMHFTSKVKPGIPFVVRDNLGNITLRASKDDTCDVKAVIRAEAKTADKAKEMVEQVGMNIDSSDKRYYLKPVKAGDDKWNNLSVNFTIAVPTGVRPDIKTNLGSIEIYGLKGHIKALTNLGSVKAVNTTGNVNLATDLGKIKFTAPKDMTAGNVVLYSKMGDVDLIAPEGLSATIQAETKMGSITSDLPLNINKTDMFKRKADGTLGSGGVSIRLTTDMGSIKISNKPPKSPEPKNDPEPMIPGDAIRNNADKLDTQLIQLEATAKKTGASLYFIKHEQEGERFLLKRFETMTTPLSPGSVLDIKSKDGNVTVQGSDTDQCSVTSTFAIETPSMDQTKDLSKKISLETTPGNKKLTLKTVGPLRTPSNHTYYVNLNVTVPRNTTVTLHKEDGDIRISNLEGQIQINSEDGNVTCENVTGDTRLTSEDGDITYKNITGNARITSEDGNVSIKASHLTQLNVKKEDGNIHCDEISGDCDVSIEDGNVTVSFAEDMATNGTCIVRGEDGNVKITGGKFAKCQVNRDSGKIDCDNVSGTFDLKLQEGQAVVNYANDVPESCSVNVRLEEGSINLSAPGRMFPADAPSAAKKRGEGAEWKTTASTPGGGTRTVTLRVDEGSVKVEKR